MKKFIFGIIAALGIMFTSCSGSVNTNVDSTPDTIEVVDTVNADSVAVDSTL